MSEFGSVIERRSYQTGFETRRSKLGQDNPRDLARGAKLANVNHDGTIIVRQNCPFREGSWHRLHQAQLSALMHDNIDSISLTVHH
jgi:hypothetical protein